MPRLQLLLKKLFKNLSICCIVNTTAIQGMLKIHHLVYNKIASTPLMQCFPEGYQSSFVSSVGNTCLWLLYVCLFCASWSLLPLDSSPFTTPIIEMTSKRRMTSAANSFGCFVRPIYGGYI